MFLFGVSLFVSKLRLTVKASKFCASKTDFHILLAYYRLAFGIMIVNLLQLAFIYPIFPKFSKPVVGVILPTIRAGKSKISTTGFNSHFSRLYLKFSVTEPTLTPIYWDKVFCLVFVPTRFD